MNIIQKPTRLNNVYIKRLVDGTLLLLRKSVSFVYARANCNTGNCFCAKAKLPNKTAE
jgi:hypothetical protein